tara:strand:- start:597 stop:1214 length:618 start_codon:yes stop_codon:yes gene_type:complete
MDLNNLGLYFISDPILSKNIFKNISSALDANVKVIQLRDKYKDKSELLEDAYKIRELTKNKALFIINDHIDIALEVDADGVHIGDTDIHPEKVRKLLKDKIIGYSTHSLSQAIQASKFPINYLSVGPIFKTTTKPNLNPVGILLLKEVINKIKKPVVAIGGINETNFNQVLEAGVKNIAMITAILKGNVYDQCMEFNKLFAKNSI